MLSLAWGVRELEVEEEDKKGWEGSFSSQDSDFPAFNMETHPYPLCNVPGRKNPLWFSAFLCGVRRSGCLTAGWKAEEDLGSHLSFHRFFNQTLFSVPASLLLFRAFILSIPEAFKDFAKHICQHTLQHSPQHTQQFVFSDKLFAIPPLIFFFVFIYYGLGFQLTPTFFQDICFLTFSLWDELFREQGDENNLYSAILIKSFQ